MVQARLSAAIFAGLLLACPAPANAQSLSGPAEAIDGDTLSFTGMHVRLSGIDAVELKQTCVRASVPWTCGEEARAALAQLIDGRIVTCVAQETDPYGRLVAVCKAGSIDLGEAMVSAGLAAAYTQYSDAYVENEARAKQFRLGIWASDFEDPAAWRAAHPHTEPKPQRVAAEAPAKPRVYRDDLGRCAIKGNHSRYGDWIYHLPGQTYYDQTRPEQTFCTEEAAQRAGYRPSKV